MTHKYKKYIVFQWESHQAGSPREVMGGLWDITDSFNLLEDALASIVCNYAQIVDRDTWEIVYSE